MTKYVDYYFSFISRLTLLPKFGYVLVSLEWQWENLHVFELLPTPSRRSAITTEMHLWLASLSLVGTKLLEDRYCTHCSNKCHPQGILLVIYRFFLLLYLSHTKIWYCTSLQYSIQISLLLSDTCSELWSRKRCIRESRSVKIRLLVEKLFLICLKIKNHSSVCKNAFISTSEILFCNKLHEKVWMSPWKVKVKNYWVSSVAFPPRLLSEHC